MADFNLGVALNADPSGFNSAMDNAAKKSADSFALIYDTAKQYLGMAGVAGTFARAADAAGKFYQAVADIGAISGQPLEGLDNLLLGIDSRISTALGSANTMYEVFSSGIDGTNKEIADLTEIIGKTANVIRADIVSTGDAMTTIMNAWGISATEAKDIMDGLFITVREGKAHGDELARTFGLVTATASAMGTELDDLFAAVAILSRTQSSSQSMIGLNQMLNAIIKPTMEARAAAKKWGVEISATAIQTKGLAGVLRELRDKVGGNVEALEAMFGNIRAGRAVLALTGTQFDEYIKVLDQMRGKSGSAEEAFKKQMDTMRAETERFKNEVTKAFITVGKDTEVVTTTLAQFGSSLLESFRSSSSGIGDFVSDINDLLGTTQKIPEELDKQIKYFSRWTLYLMGALRAYKGISDHFTKISNTLANIRGDMGGPTGGGDGKTPKTPRTPTSKFSKDTAAIDDTDAALKRMTTTITTQVSPAVRGLSNAFESIQASVKAIAAEVITLDDKINIAKASASGFATAVTGLKTALSDVSKLAAAITTEMTAAGSAVTSTNLGLKLTLSNLAAIRVEQGLVTAGYNAHTAAITAANLALTRQIELLQTSRAVLTGGMAGTTSASKPAQPTRPAQPTKAVQQSFPLGPVAMATSQAKMYETYEDKLYRNYVNSAIPNYSYENQLEREFFFGAGPEPKAVNNKRYTQRDSNGRFINTIFPALVSDGGATSLEDGFANVTNISTAPTSATPQPARTKIPWRPSSSFMLAPAIVGGSTELSDGFTGPKIPASRLSKRIETAPPAPDLTTRPKVVTIGGKQYTLGKDERFDPVVPIPSSAQPPLPPPIPTYQSSAQPADAPPPMLPMPPMAGAPMAGSSTLTWTKYAPGPPPMPPTAGAPPLPPPIPTYQSSAQPADAPPPMLPMPPMPPIKGKQPAQPAAAPVVLAETAAPTPSIGTKIPANRLHTRIETAPQTITVPGLSNVKFGNRRFTLEQIAALEQQKRQTAEAYSVLSGTPLGGMSPSAYTEHREALVHAEQASTEASSALATARQQNMALSAPHAPYANIPRAPSINVQRETAKSLKGWAFAGYAPYAEERRANIQSRWDARKLRRQMTPDVDQFFASGPQKPLPSIYKPLESSKMPGVPYAQGTDGFKAFSRMERDGIKIKNTGDIAKSMANATARMPGFGGGGGSAKKFSMGDTGMEKAFNAMLMLQVAQMGYQFGKALDERFGVSDKASDAWTGAGVMRAQQTAEGMQAQAANTTRIIERDLANPTGPKLNVLERMELQKRVAFAPNEETRITINNEYLDLINQRTTPEETRSEQLKLAQEASDKAKKDLEEFRERMKTAPLSIATPSRTAVIGGAIDKYAKEQEIQGQRRDKAASAVEAYVKFSSPMYIHDEEEQRIKERSDAIEMLRKAAVGDDFEKLYTNVKAGDFEEAGLGGYSKYQQQVVKDIITGAELGAVDGAEISDMEKALENVKAKSDTDKQRIKFINKLDEYQENFDNAMRDFGLEMIDQYEGFGSENFTEAAMDRAQGAYGKARETLDLIREEYNRQLKEWTDKGMKGAELESNLTAAKDRLNAAFAKMSTAEKGVYDSLAKWQANLGRTILEAAERASGLSPALLGRADIRLGARQLMFTKTARLEAAKNLKTTQDELATANAELEGSRGTPQQRLTLRNKKYAFDAARKALREEQLNERAMLEDDVKFKKAKLDKAMDDMENDPRFAAETAVKDAEAEYDAAQGERGEARNLIAQRKLEVARAQKAYDLNPNKDTQNNLSRALNDQAKAEEAEKAAQQRIADAKKTLDEKRIALGAEASPQLDKDVREAEKKLAAAKAELATQQATPGRILNPESDNPIESTEGVEAAQLAVKEAEEELERKKKAAAGAQENPELRKAVKDAEAALASAQKDLRTGRAAPSANLKKAQDAFLEAQKELQEAQEAVDAAPADPNKAADLETKKKKQEAAEKAFNDARDQQANYEKSIAGQRIGIFQMQMERADIGKEMGKIGGVAYRKIQQAMLKNIEMEAKKLYNKAVQDYQANGENSIFTPTDIAEFATNLDKATLATRSFAKSMDFARDMNQQGIMGGVQSFSNMKDSRGDLTATSLYHSINFMARLAPPERLLGSPTMPTGAVPEALNFKNAASAQAGVARALDAYIMSQQYRQAGLATTVENIYSTLRSGSSIVVR